jgi:GlcNAc-P-P-Und epimerase
MPHKYIITGGSGFIGSHLISQILDAGELDEIHVFDIIEPKFKNKNILFHFCDIRKPIHINIDIAGATCFHLAALAKEPGYPWDDYFDTNYIGTINVINFCQEQGVKRIIYTSTMMVYRPGNERMTENSLTSPDTGYGISKLLGELILKAWSNDPSNILKIVRISVVFGKGENGNFTRLFYALKGRKFFYIGRKTTIKSNIYVKDVVRFLLFSITKDSKSVVYNLSFPDAYTIQKICDTFFKVFGFYRIILVIPYSLAIAVGYCFELLSIIGIKTSIHHRRIQKLYFSTNIEPSVLIKEGFTFNYNLESSLIDWQNDCESGNVY